jgi:hypothetical protein
VIDDTDESTTPARQATPLPEMKGKDPAKDAEKSEDAPAKDTIDSEQNGEKGNTDKAGTEQSTRASSPADPVATELPAEVRARLRKLDKLEKTYPGSHTTPELLIAFSTLKQRPC